MNRLLLYIVITLTAISCMRDDDTFVQTVNNIPATVNVGFEHDDTRISLNEAGKSVWNTDDRVSLFYKGTTCKEWKFNGKTGDRYGTLIPTGNFEQPSASSTIIVAYPYKSDYTYSKSSGKIGATIAATQHYAEHSYGESGNILVAQGNPDKLSLKNVYGWLKIQLTAENESVKYIRLTGNNSEQLTGSITINPVTAEASFSTSDTTATTVTLDCSDGVALNGSTPTSFYIGLLPQTFSGGITIVVESANGEVMTKSTTKSVTIARKTVQPMSSFEFTPEGIESMFPTDTQVWYNTADETKHTFSTSTPFDKAIESHDFGACANGMCYNLYSIGFASPITKVNSQAFTHSNLSVVYLPNSVTTIGASAFLGSTNLKNVHLGSKITTIEMGAFTNCTSLEGLYIRSTTPPSLGEYALLSGGGTSGYSYIGCFIYVPASAVDSYKSNKYWSRYSDYIRAYDFVSGEEVEIEDPDAGTGSGFNHRLLIVDHTGEECGYCPNAMDRLLALSQSDYIHYYNEVTIHGGIYSESGDPAYSYAASVVDDFYKPSGYPDIRLNFYGKKISHSGSDNVFVNTTMYNIFNTYRKAAGADAGIAVSTNAKSGQLTIDVEVKSAKTQQYHVTAWVLENDIYSPYQNGATKEHHYYYNHALRYVAGAYSSSDISGDSLGTISDGNLVKKSYTVALDSSQATNNLEVLVIVSAPNADGKYEVVNTALCPINGSKDYEYIKDIN